MKNKTITTIIASIFLISLASATLINSISNSVTSEITVEGPTFYLTENNKLTLNEQPLKETQDEFPNVETIEYILSDEYELNSLDFYDPEIEFNLDLEVSNLSKPRAVRLEFGFINDERDALPICSTLFLNIDENGTYEIPCSQNEDHALENIKKFYFRIGGQSDESITYKIKTKQSFIKITGAK